MEAYASNLALLTHSLILPYNALVIPFEACPWVPGLFNNKHTQIKTGKLIPPRNYTCAIAYYKKYSHLNYLRNFVNYICNFFPYNSCIYSFSIKIFVECTYLHLLPV